MKWWFSVKLFLGWGEDAAIGVAFHEQMAQKFLQFCEAGIDDRNPLQPRLGELSLSTNWDHIFSPKTVNKCAT
jgi:hypothetical protein